MRRRMQAFGVGLTCWVSAAVFLLGCDKDRGKEEHAPEPNQDRQAAPKTDKPAKHTEAHKKPSRSVGVKDAKEELELKIYDVGDLTQFPPSLCTLPSAGPPDLLLVEVERAMKSTDEALWQSMRPAALEGSERMFEISANKLIVLEPPTVHQWLDKYLAYLRKAHGVSYGLLQDVDRWSNDNPEWTKEMKAKLNRHVSLNLKDATFEEALRCLAGKAKFDIQFEPNEASPVSERITLHVDDRPYHDALGRFLAKANLDATFRDGRLFIASCEHVAGERTAVRARALFAPLAKAELTACRIKDEEISKDAERAGKRLLVDWPILEEKKIEDKEAAAGIRKVLQSADTYAEKGNNCFEPGMGFRFSHEGEDVCAVICLKCRWIYCYKGDTRQYFALSEAGVRALQKVYDDWLKPSGDLQAK
ncbi:MAG: hypothetical protein HY291_13430 [Planctomycetes bacterium]|nr:hypothetical protein [Planctomycetota bacterium]